MATFIQIFLYTTFILYVAGAVFYLLGYRIKNNKLVQMATFLALFGCVVNVLVLLLRAIITGRLPLSSGSEFILVFTWLTVLLYLLFEWRTKSKHVGGAVMTIAALLTFSVMIIERGQLGNVSPLMPALKSPWLTIHVLTAALAYAGFVLAAGLAAIQLQKLKRGHSVQGNGIYRIVAAGFVMLSLSIIIGAVWAEQAWGSYWSWDPKEVWALITWIIYAIYLHLHQRNIWRGERACWMVIAGFLVILFTFFGVNYLLSGMHSYASAGVNIFY